MWETIGRRISRMYQGVWTVSFQTSKRTGTYGAQPSWPLTGLWRLNWIHPFVEGNGRTARAVCYFLLCVRAGSLLPGRKILPERIKDDRAGYEAALIEADYAWDDGHLDFTAMEAYLAPLVEAQLDDLP